MISFIIRCAADSVADTLQTVRDYVAEGHADPLLDKMIRENRRKPRATKGQDPSTSNTG